MILPVLFEEQVLGVVELASFNPFSAVQMQFLEQLMESIGVSLNAIIASSRTQELLVESQRLASELQEKSGELEAQQKELQQTNAELEDKASLLAAQNRAIEIKNLEIEDARRGLEDRAEQLALSSKYKSEFLANMSHELQDAAELACSSSPSCSPRTPRATSTPARSSSPARSTPPAPTCSS